MYCKHCKIDFLEMRESCPFCGMALSEQTQELSNNYPNISEKERFKRKSIRFVFFVLLFLETLFLIIDFKCNTSSNKHWSLLTGVIFAYFFFSFRRILYLRAGHIMEYTIQAFAIFLLILYIDWNTGWSGWCISLGIPILNGALLFITSLSMVIDRRNWQTYLLSLLFSLLIACLSLVLSFLNVTNYFPLSCGVFAISLFLFLGTLILGDYTATNELKWKFHV